MMKGWIFSLMIAFLMVGCSSKEDNCTMVDGHKVCVLEHTVLLRESNTGETKCVSPEYAAKVLTTHTILGSCKDGKNSTVETMVQEQAGSDWAKLGLTGN